ncbi:MAG: hypothetical protein MUC84_06590 [Solirubrobacteraceae bacterium]|jgi:Icc-related predicted phosphoesterase|nr:hypothetical protein [Solirubrobacteraceae bacterium]
MRLYFATDLHGSEVCFRKFCAALDFYSCDALVMGGDVSGKMLVLFEREPDGYVFELAGERHHVAEDELAGELARIANMGSYGVVVTPDEAAHLRSDGEAYEARLLAEALERARAWGRYADERLGPAGRRILFAPGNDDEQDIDAAFAESEVFVLGEGRVVALDGVEVACTGWANPTPWKTPRETTEEDLEQRLRALTAEVRDPERAVFAFHVPPSGTPLDVCPEIDEDFAVVTHMGNPVMHHAGSSAVRAVIEDVQPRVSLHGHIHESRGAARLGRTLCLNPGSEYGEGVLNGVIVDLGRRKARHTFTSG